MLGGKSRHIFCAPCRPFHVVVAATSLRSHETTRTPALHTFPHLQPVGLYTPPTAGHIRQEWAEIKASAQGRTTGLPHALNVCAVHLEMGKAAREECG